MVNFTKNTITQNYASTNNFLSLYPISELKKAYDDIKVFEGDIIRTYTKAKFIKAMKNMIKEGFDYSTKEEKEEEKKERLERQKEETRRKRNQRRREKAKQYKIKIEEPREVFQTLEQILQEIHNIYGDSTNQYELTIKSPHGIIFRQILKGLEHLEYIQEGMKKDNDFIYGERDSVGNWQEVKYDDQYKNIHFTFDLDPIGGGCYRKSGYAINKKRVGVYDCSLYNPKSKHELNNCGFVCLNHLLKDLNITINASKERKQLNKNNRELITPEQLTTIFYKLKQEYNIKKGLQIITENFTNKIDLDKYYFILLHDKHYSIIDNVDKIEKQDHTKRGFLYWDCEARPNETKLYNMRINGNIEKVERIDDTITQIYYKPYKKTEYEKKYFKSNNEKSSVRQFLDFIISENNAGRSYNCFAHNCARFDLYLLISSLNSDELKQSNMTLRGLSVINFELFNNIFRDTCCFLTDSLDNLCNDFKVKNKKQTFINYKKNNYTNTEFCFYKPKLTYTEFLELEQKEPEYWELYKNYCLYDCISLCEIWSSFTETIQNLILNIDPELLKNCDLNKSMTIGGFSKKLLMEYNKKHNKELYTKIMTFCNTEDKFNFLNNSYNYKDETTNTLFKRGGISHCNMAGLHKIPVVGYDIKSQYPASMLYMNIALGESYFTTEYNINEFGFYHIQNCVFKTNQQLKPVSIIKDDGILEWNTPNTIKDLFVDSDMIKYLQDNYNLISFDIKKGLVTKTKAKGECFFGEIIRPLYQLKQDQDKLKETKDPQYNPALRSAIKLILNSISGKLIENIIHKSINWCSDSLDCKKINGSGCTFTTSTKENNELKFNWLLPLGLMVYSFSKRLLFNYINCLPNKSDDIIHIETDGIYFHQKYDEDFRYNLEQRGTDLLRIGDELGNIEHDMTTKDWSYWLGKKFYYYVTEYKEVMRIKGIRQKTINNDGSNRDVVTKETYERIFKGEIVETNFKAIKKNLMGAETNLLSYDMHREIKANCNYKIYN